jgi:hypothetical protein
LYIVVNQLRSFDKKVRKSKKSSYEIA